MADVGHVCVKGNTALYHAASNGHTSCVRLLLSFGAEPSVRYVASGGTCGMACARVRDTCRGHPYISLCLHTHMMRHVAVFVRARGCVYINCIDCKHVEKMHSKGSLKGRERAKRLEGCAE